MKSFLLVAILITTFPYLYAQTEENLNEVMIVKSYFVEHILESQIGSAQKPTYQKTISIAGQPQGESKMKHVQLHFSVDKKKYTQNPEIESNNEKVVVWLPMNEFEHYYKMLSHKQGSMKATFIQNTTRQIRRLEIVVNGNLPLED